MNQFTGDGIDFDDKRRVDTALNLALRMEYVDWNKGRFKETGERVGDDAWSFMSGISFIASALSVLRLNYRFIKEKDLFANPTERTDEFNFGAPIYF